MKNITSYLIGTATGIVIFALILAFNDYNLFGVGLSDAWISFLGAIAGGIVTIIGVYLTLGHNRKLMEESHNKQMNLMLTQVRTQFWMEKFSDIIVFAENINNDIVKFINEFNEMDLSSNIMQGYKINYINDKIYELDKYSQSIYPMIYVDETLDNAFKNYKKYILDLYNNVGSNFDFDSYSKKYMKDIEYDVKEYNNLKSNLMRYVVIK